MTAEIHVLFVPITPVAKARPRLSKFGVYTPKKTTSYEQQVATLVRASTGGRFSANAKPVAVSLSFHVPIPESWPSKKRLAAQNNELKPTGRPDIDNYAKAIMDALNGVLWLDDSQVVNLYATKRYSTLPGVQIKMEVFV